MTAATMPPQISGARALAVAEADALQAYGDLSPYRIQVALEADGWHVDYQPADPRRKGGGPHYVIDATHGVILAKRCEQ